MNNATQAGKYLALCFNRKVTTVAQPQQLPIRYPFVLPASPWRRAIKVGLGRLALAARPGTAGRLLAAGDPNEFSLVDRLIMIGWVSRAQPEDWAALSAMHQRFWAGQGGALFSASADIAERFDDWFLREHARPVELLRRELSDTGAPALCEIGSGNGLALAYLGDQLPMLPRLVGIDINAEATRNNTERWRTDTRLEFVHADAVDWIESHAGPGWVYFSNAGVLEYFPQDKVTRLYQATAGFGGEAWWVLTEPVYNGFDLDTEKQSRPHGSEFSFCHNHPHLLRQAGWDIVEQYETDVEGTRFLTVCARRSDQP